MKLFIRNLALFLLVQLVIWGGVLWVYAKHRPFGKLYLAATIDKDKLLAEQPSPRIVFVGGSNLPMGIDSAEIGRRLGYHPVNMGLHVSLGLDFMLNEAEPSLRAGDVVIVSPEYELFGSQHYPGEADILFSALEQRPANIKYFSWHNARPLLDGGYALASDILDYDMRCLSGGRDPNALEDPNNVYKRSAFNEAGDVVAHRLLPPKSVEAPSIAAEVSPDSIRRTINRLNLFAAACQQKGIRVLYSYPTVSDPYFERNRKTLDLIAATLNQQLSFPIIDTPDEHHLPLDEFFDTYYHLLAAGIATRTTHLIERLSERGLSLAPSSK
jgi:hypothetical protein